LTPQNKTPKAEIASGVFYLYGRSEVGDRRNLVVSALCVKLLVWVCILIIVFSFPFPHTNNWTEVAR